MNFKERYLQQQIMFEQINEYIEAWNQGEVPQRLAQYLGLDAEEEDIWIVEGDEALEALLSSKIKKT